MPETPLGNVGPVIVETLKFGAFTMQVTRPAEPELLLDLEEVAQAYDKDQYMPYWAAIWPVCKHLAREIRETPWKPGLKALEVGCGLGIPGIAALQAGLHVTFSDYDATALKFAAESARGNGLHDFRLLLLDWRSPPSETYDVIIGSDVVYEERNIEPLVALFKKVLAPGGVAMLADQNRPHADLLTSTLRREGFVSLTKDCIAMPEQGYDVAGRLYWVRRV